MFPLKLAFSARILLDEKALAAFWCFFRSCVYGAVRFAHDMDPNDVKKGNQWGDPDDFQRSVDFHIPIGSMYGIFTNICPKNHPNVGK